MSDGTPDARGNPASVIAALRAQAEGAVDASIPINPQDLLVLLDTLDAQQAPFGADIENSVSDRYHSRRAHSLGRHVDDEPSRHVDDPDAAA